MQKAFKWQEPGRESLEIFLEMDGSRILKTQMKVKGSLDFLRLSQKMKARLKGPVEELTPPVGSDPPSLIWQEMIGQIQEKWALPISPPELCHCRKISTKAVDRAIVFGAHSLAEIRHRTSANTGCGTCQEDVMKMINHRLRKAP